MKNTLKLLALCLIISVNIMAQENKKSKSDLYEGCCGTKPVEFTFGKAFVYIPNAFTPNDDGLNDVFFPFISDDIVEVQDYSILSAEGDTLIYSKSTFKYSEFTKYAWKGKRYRPNGTPESDYVGLFKYGMRIVNTLGQQKIIEGEACVIQNEDDKKILKNKNKCFFADQADDDNDYIIGKIKGKGGSAGKGKIDKKKKTKEKDLD
jgi:hypothetical protein